MDDFDLTSDEQETTWQLLQEYHTLEEEMPSEYQPTARSTLVKLQT